jgi:hypothetical protein
MICIIIDPSKMTKEVKPKVETFDDLKLTNRCNDTMKRYLYFLYWHHGYSIAKLKQAFPEYIEQ